MSKNNGETARSSRVPFIKGVIAGAVAISLLAVGVGLAHSSQSEEVAALRILIDSDKASSNASNITLSSIPGMDELAQHNYMQSDEWEAFVTKVNINNSFLSDRQQEIRQLKAKTVFPDLKLKLEEIESTINDPSDLSPLGFKDTYTDVAILQDIRYLCRGHEATIRDGELVFRNDTADWIPSLSATVLQISGNDANARSLQKALKAGIDVYC